MGLRKTTPGEPTTRVAGDPDLRRPGLVRCTKVRKCYAAPNAAAPPFVVALVRSCSAAAPFVVALVRGCSAALPFVAALVRGCSAAAPFVAALVWGPTARRPADCGHLQFAALGPGSGGSAGLERRRAGDAARRAADAAGGAVRSVAVRRSAHRCATRCNP